MPHRPMPMVEPFVEQVSARGASAGPAGYRFGYRTEDTKDIISAVDISAEAVERALSRGLSLSVRIAPDGRILPGLAGADGFPLDLSITPSAAPIDGLIAETVAPENLHLEEANAAELNALLDRLQRSVSLVREALDRVESSR